MDIFTPEPGWGKRWLLEAFRMIGRCPEVLAAFLIMTFFCGAIDVAAPDYAEKAIGLMLSPLWIILAGWSVNRMLQKDGKRAAFSVWDVIVSSAGAPASSLYIVAMAVYAALTFSGMEDVPEPGLDNVVYLVICGAFSAFSGFAITVAACFRPLICALGFSREEGNAINESMIMKLGDVPSFLVFAGFMITGILFTPSLVLMLYSAWAYCALREMVGGVCPKGPEPRLTENPVL